MNDTASTKLYDKRDDFGFDIVNFPFLEVTGRFGPESFRPLVVKQGKGFSRFYQRHFE